MLAENPCSRAKLGKGKWHSQVSLPNVPASSLRGRKDGDDENKPQVRETWVRPLLDNYLISSEAPFRKRQNKAIHALCSLLLSCENVGFRGLAPVKDRVLKKRYQVKLRNHAVVKEPCLTWKEFMQRREGGNVALLLDNINSSSKQVAEGRVRQWTLTSLSHELASLKHTNMCNFIIASGQTYFKNLM